MFNLIKLMFTATRSFGFNDVSTVCRFYDFRAHDGAHKKMRNKKERINLLNMISRLICESSVVSSPMKNSLYF